MLISIVIRTLNEEMHLSELLSSIDSQLLPDDCETEIIVVDSGSTDATLEIAERYNCRISHISQEEFSFRRSRLVTRLFLEELSRLVAVFRAQMIADCL